ncbi:MAG: hypothetical protein KBF23_01200 [Agitococcus sp.]|nr:hypothetical protein [Moraxellaceae bacterium]MBL0231888.1 hypothetical protein [Moraxellaceae bacterium]MBP9215764.1 hypothetical protein [Agitococcus sp.]HQV79720.1 hypothetical protein [Agitococcus sp.]
MAINPSRMQFDTQSKASFIERFGFRGLSNDGRYAFLLEHSLQKTAQDAACLTVLLVCFDKKTTKTHTIYEQESLSTAQLTQFLAHKTWKNCVFSFASGAFFEINQDNLRGKLHSHLGSVSWHLRLHRQHQVWQLKNPLWYWLKKWPASKLQLADSNIKYLGKIQTPDLDLATDFAGSSFHYWGVGHPAEYAFAECHQFNSTREGFFCGFSRRASLSPRFSLPYFSMASFKIGQKTYHFQELKHCLRHKVDALDDYRWHISYQNAHYILEVEIEGINPRLMPWVSWQSTGVAIKTTEFAQGKFILYRRDTLEVEESLLSEAVTLQTHLPENMTHEPSFWLTP